VTGSLRIDASRVSTRPVQEECAGVNCVGDARSSTRSRVQETCLVRLSLSRSRCTKLARCANRRQADERGAISANKRICESRADVDDKRGIPVRRGIVPQACGMAEGDDR
jgi:hypothetical protein